jgi:hypothetical protein
MDEHGSRQRQQWLIPAQAQRSEGRVQYLLGTEERILRSIAVRAPVPQILNEICTALDCQIGNMVSLISLPQDDIANTAEVARNAVLFGLHIFSSAGIFCDCGEELGSLEMYCCTARNPSSPELQLIERAVCLAAIAIGCEMKAGHQGHRRLPEKGPARGSADRWPVSMN